MERVIMSRNIKLKINNSKTSDLILDKPAIRKETIVIRTYDYELSETTVSIKCSYLPIPGFHIRLFYILKPEQNPFKQFICTELITR